MRGPGLEAGERGSGLGGLGQGWGEVAWELTCAMVSGSRFLPWGSEKPVYCPEEVERRMGGLSIFLRDSWREMLVRLPCPARRRRSGLSRGRCPWLRLRSRSLGLK